MFVSFNSNTTRVTSGAGTANPPEHLNSLPVFWGVRVARSSGFCVLFCRSLFVLLSFYLVIALYVNRFTVSFVSSTCSSYKLYICASFLADMYLFYFNKLLTVISSHLQTLYFIFKTNNNNDKYIPEKTMAFTKTFNFNSIMKD